MNLSSSTKAMVLTASRPKKNPSEIDATSSSSSSSPEDDNEESLKELSDSTTFANVQMESSNGAHLGNRIYQGPVTIRHTVVYSNGGSTTVGVENPAFDHQDEDLEAKSKPHPPLQSKGCGRRWRPSPLIVVGSSIILLLLVLVVGLIVALILVVNRSERRAVADGTSRANCSEDIRATSPPIHVVCRQKWGAQRAIRRFSQGEQAPLVVISDTSSIKCFNEAECGNVARSTQRSYIDSKGWYDIPYNFLIGGDGVVYEGRGWNTQARLKKLQSEYNDQVVLLALIGTFDTDSASELQVITCQRLIEGGVKLGHIHKDYKLLGVRQLYEEVDSPGEVLFQQIKNWTHWVEAI